MKRVLKREVLEILRKRGDQAPPETLKRYGKTLSEAVLYCLLEGISVSLEDL